MARRKIKWGPGNPLWEWKNKGRVSREGLFSRVSRAASRPGKRTSVTRVMSMGRFRRHRGHKKGNQIMRIAKRGLVPLGGGILGALAVGALVGYAQKSGMIPNVGFGVIPENMETHVVPLVAGGLPGVLAAAVVKGGLGTGSSGSSGIGAGY